MMSYRSFLFLLLGIAAIAQFTATAQRTQVERQRLATNQTVTDLARIAGAVQTLSLGMTAAGGGVAAADVTWDALGVHGVPCDSAAAPTHGACVEVQPGVRYELRPDSGRGVEIVATGDRQGVVARAHVRGPARDDVAIEIVR